MRKVDKLTPAQLPCLLSGVVVFRSLLGLGNGNLRRTGLRSTRIDMVTGFSTIEVILAVFLLSLGERASRLNGIDFHRPRSVRRGLNSLSSGKSGRSCGRSTVRVGSSGSIEVIMSFSSSEKEVVPFDSRINEFLKGSEALRRQESVLDVQLETIEEGLSQCFIAP